MQDKIFSIAMVKGWHQLKKGSPPNRLVLFFRGVGKQMVGLGSGLNRPLDRLPHIW